MQPTTTRPKIIVTADGDGVISRVGSRLLADIADRTTLTAALSQVLGGLRRPRTRHDPGRVLVDMAVALADGASTISDVAVLPTSPRCSVRSRRTRRAGGCWTVSTNEFWPRSPRRGPEPAKSCGPSTPRPTDSRTGHFPSRDFAINSAWLTVTMLAIDLLAWTQQLLLDGELAKAEPKTLRYRLLHVAARLARGGRRVRVRIQRSWPWAEELAAAFGRFHALPVPAG